MPLASLVSWSSVYMLVGLYYVYGLVEGLVEVFNLVELVCVVQWTFLLLQSLNPLHKVSGVLVEEVNYFFCNISDGPVKLPIS